MHSTFLAECHKEMGDKDNHLYGEVLEIIPNKKLVYTFIPDEEYRPRWRTPQAYSSDLEP